MERQDVEPLDARLRRIRAEIEQSDRWLREFQVEIEQLQADESLQKETISQPHEGNRTERAVAAAVARANQEWRKQRRPFQELQRQVRLERRRRRSSR